jgi:predicted dehydrogenase
MRRAVSIAFVVACATACVTTVRKEPPVMPEHGHRWIILDPGHFHAALIQKEMLPEIDPLAHVYAPLGPDLLSHLNRVSAFNHRKESPTRWQLEVYAGEDFLERMLDEHPGSLVVLSGRNREKIGRVMASVERGLHVLADKPWIISSADFPKLEGALSSAEKSSVVAFDGMTQRFEVTYVLARELLRDAAIFGGCLPGSDEEPAVRMESLHHLLKEVAGKPSLRPAWFFDVREQGEGLADVGTHLVDLVQWIVFPDEAIDHRADVEVTSGKHWPTTLTLEQFRRVTGEADFPEDIKEQVKDGRLEYYSNNSVAYTVRGVLVEVAVRWEFEAPPGSGDTELAVFSGKRSRVEVRKGKEEGFRPEVYVVPARLEEKEQILAAVARRLQALQGRLPGLAVEDLGSRIRVSIPDALRQDHEAHFAILVRKFLQYVKDPASVPAWERPNMLSKYHVTTRGVDLARKN